MKYSIPHSQKGSVLIMALAIMLLITIVGLGALNTTDTELRIAGNDRCFKQNIYRAESAVIEAAQVMANDTTPLANLNPETGSSLDWIHRNDPSLFRPLSDSWTYTGASPNAKRSTHFTDQESGYTVVYRGIAPGASLDLNASGIMRQYDVYGRAEQCQGHVDVIAGYRLRF